MYGVSVLKSSSDVMHAGPSLVGETRLQPGVRVAPRVDRLTVVKIVGHHSGRAGRPALVGDNGLDMAVGEFDLELR